MSYGNPYTRRNNPKLWKKWNHQQYGGGYGQSCGYEKVYVEPCHYVPEPCYTPVSDCYSPWQPKRRYHRRPRRNYCW